MLIVTIILQSWLLFSMAFFGGSKIAGAKHQIDLLDSVKLPQWLRVVTGYLQIAACIGLIIGYWLPVFAAWAAIGVAVMMAVAILSHVRVKHAIGKMIPAILNLLIAAAVVLVSLNL